MKSVRVMSVVLMGVSLLFLTGCQEGASRAKAIELALNTPVSGVLKSGTVVYYKFTVETEKIYEIKVRESVPLRMTLLDAEGNVVDYAEEGFKAYWGGLTFDPAGVYYLRIDAPKDYLVEYPAYSDETLAAYELMLAEVLPVEEVTGSALVPLTLGKAVENQVVDFFNSKLYYQVSVPATVGNTVVRYSVSTTQLDNAYPVYMRMYDSTGKYVTGNSKSISVSTKSAAATYIVVVEMSGDYGKAYANMADEYAKTIFSILFDLAPQVKVDPVSKNVSSAGGSFTVTITNSGGGKIGSWNAYSGSYFLSIDSASSGTDTGVVTVTYSANSDCYNRYGSIYIESNYGGSASVSVSQAGSEDCGSW